MNSNRIVTIKEKIKEKLETATHLNGVYDYVISNANGYPYAVVSLSDFSSEFGDFSALSKRIIRRWNFVISIYVESNEASFGTEKAERVAIETVDEILGIFDSDLTLSGEVKQVEVINGSFSYEQTGSIIRVAELNLNIFDLVNTN